MKKTESIIIKIIFISLLWAVCFNSIAQDPQLSQYYASSLYLGPSFAGATSGGRFILDTREQYPNLAGKYTTLYASYDHFFPKQSSGFGIMAMRDMEGDHLVTDNLSACYSINIRVKRKLYMKYGVMASRIYRRIDASKYIFKDQLIYGLPVSVSHTNMEETISLWDYTASLLVYGTNFWVGSTAHHVTTPDQGFFNMKNELPFKLTVYGGANFRDPRRVARTTDEGLSIHFLYKHQNKFDQLELGTYYNTYPFIIGVSYRGLPFKRYAPGYGNAEAIIFLLGIKFKHFGVGYSYDFNLSDIAGYSGGAHEMSLVFKIAQKKGLEKRGKQRIIPVPKY